MSPSRYTRAMLLSYLFDDGPAGGAVPRRPPPFLVQPHPPVGQDLGSGAALAGHQFSGGVHVLVPGVEVPLRVRGGDERPEPDVPAPVGRADHVPVLLVAEHRPGTDLDRRGVLRRAKPPPGVAYVAPLDPL